MGYLDFISSLSNVSIWGIISVFFLTLMRIVPIIALAPFFGKSLGPGIARMGLAIALTILFLPFVASRINEPIGFNNAFLGYSLKELFIGFILGFMVTIPFHMVQSSGIIIDYLRGASIMQSQDPTMQSQASPIGQLYNYILIVLFFQIGGPILFLDGVLQSYDIVPVNGYFNPLFFSPQNPFWKISIDLINKIISIAIQMAAPSLVAILMAEMFLGIANRLAPQVQIAFLGMSIKSLLGLALLWAAWFFVLKQFTKLSNNWLDVIKELISYMTLFNPS